jgi:hypothetical protein
MASHRYSLRVRIIRPSGLIACAALIASCAPSQPPLEIPVAAHVMISRVISENIPPRPPDCPIETLSAMPQQPYREVGDIQISNADPAQHDTRTIINQHACAMGADAVVIRTAPTGQSGGLIDATAIAYASSLASRVAQARPTGIAEESGSTPQLQGPAPAELPMSAGDESSSSERSEQPASSGKSASMPQHSILPVPAAVSPPGGDETH